MNRFQFFPLTLVHRQSIHQWQMSCFRFELNHADIVLVSSTEASTIHFHWISPQFVLSSHHQWKQQNPTDQLLNNEKFDWNKWLRGFILKIDLQIKLDRRIFFWKWNFESKKIGDWYQFWSSQYYFLNEPLCFCDKNFPTPTLS